MTDRSIRGERLIRVGSLLYVLAFLCLGAGIVGALTGRLPLWWGLLAASLCGLLGHRVLRHAAHVIIGPATTPEARRAKKVLVRRVLAGDAELEAEIEVYLGDHGGAEGESGESPDA